MNEFIKQWAPTPPVRSKVSSLQRVSKLKHSLWFKGAVRPILFASLLPSHPRNGADRGTSGGSVELPGETMTPTLPRFQGFDSCSQQGSVCCHAAERCPA